jgi:alkaline phosphatase
MISDGQGFNTVKATEYWTGGQASYESSDFVKYSMQTNSANNPLGYNPTAMWSNFAYSMTGATDSASAATAMYTGVKNYDGEVNWTTDDKPLTTVFEMAAANGKSIGAVSSVQLSHATPAAVYGHNSSRNNYAAIGYEGVYGANPVDGQVANSGSNPLAGDNNNYNSNNYFGNMSVLMGAGSGSYTDNGVYNTATSDNFVGGTTAWSDITDGTAPNGWELVETQSRFNAIAAGTSVPAKLLGVAQAATTLQQGRSGYSPTDIPGSDAFNANVPTLATMTTAALNVLGQDNDGFMVMIEGGAIDWANHANQGSRMIEEQMDFNASVNAAISWIEANGGWTDNLLVVTADHETGHLWGSGTYTDTNSNGKYDSGIDTFNGYKQVVDNGDNSMPGIQWGSGDHTNTLVPLYARGAGSELFAANVIGTDADVDNMYGVDSAFNNYVDNTSIFNVIKGSTGVPEPSSALLALVGGLFVLRRRR